MLPRDRRRQIGRIRPAVLLQVKKGHPLAGNLIGAWVPAYNNNTYLDLSQHRANIAFVTGTIPTPTGDEIGLVYDCVTDATTFSWRLAAASGSRFDTLPATVVSWFKPKLTFSSFYNKLSIYSRASFSGSNRGWHMYGHYTGAQEKVGVLIDNGTTTTTLTSANAIALHQWHCGAVVLRSADTAKLFIDGVEEASATAVTWAYNAQPVSIGYQDHPVGTGTMVGSYGPHLYFDRALTDDEVRSLSRNPWAMFEPVAQFLGSTAGIPDASAGISIGFALGQAFDREPYVEQGFALGSLFPFYLEDVFGVLEAGFALGSSHTYEGELEKSIEEGFALGATFDREPYFEAGFALGGEATFETPDVFPSFEAGIGLGGEFTTDVGELSNGRYRR